MEVSQEYTINGTKLNISTGKLATLAGGSVLLKVGGTTLLATATSDKKDAVQDFFPLSVEYIEKMYARGAINGSRFQKREGMPSTEAIIKARQVDHSIRSLFPKSFKKPTSVVLTVLSYDQENDPEMLAVLGASLALSIAKLPFYGPSSGVIACVDSENNIVLNPKVENREEFLAEFLITGVDDRPLSIEGWAKEISEETMDKLLDESISLINQINEIQRDFFKKVTGEEYKLGSELKEEFSDIPTSEELINKIKEKKYEEIKTALFVKKDRDTNRQDNLRKIKDEVYAELTAENKDASFSMMDIDLAVEYIARKVVRESALLEGKRVTDRGLTQIRELSGEVDLIPTVHGSALFNRGLTQSLSIVTLGSKSSEQTIDDMEGETTKTFMHHYNMPNFSTGEAGRYGYFPGRREIGHGAIGENALKNMIPSQEVFPYTIRVVSEVLTSNGSTSMAATCASSMSLMAAGVPLKQAVAGIGVGLVSEAGNENNYRLLLDIEGIEDFYGDMDFKVTGTANGITAIQYENKLRGVKLSILKEAFRLSKTGRLEVLETMNKIISVHRSTLPATAPIVETLNIPQESIGELIGPGGKNIRELIKSADKFAKSSVDINIDDTGKVLITAGNKAQLDYIKGEIDSMFKIPQIGEEFEGVVDKIADYGVFVDVSNSISGLCHISEIFEERKNTDLNTVFNTGDKVKVKILKLENGRINFTMRGLTQIPEIEDRKKNAPEVAFNRAPRREYDRNSGRGDRERY